MWQGWCKALTTGHGKWPALCDLESGGLSSQMPRDKGWGKIGLRGRGVVGAPFAEPPPLLGSRDGALKKVIDGGT